MKKIKKQKTLTDLAVEHIKKDIVDGEIKSGDSLAESKLAKKLGVSRAVIQRALLRLKEQGLIGSNNGRFGNYLKQLSRQEIVDLWEVRETLEGLAVSKICINKLPKKDLESLFYIFKDIEKKKNYTDEYEKADRNFHKRLSELSGNKLLANILETFSIQIKTFQLGVIRKPEETLKEHLEIIECIAKNDSLLAQEKIQKHINKSLNAFLNKHFNV